MKANYRVTFDQGCGATVFVVRVSGETVTVLNKQGDKSDLRWLSNSAGELMVQLMDASSKEEGLGALKRYCDSGANVELIEPVK